MRSTRGLERRYYRGRIYWRMRWSGGYVHFDRDGDYAHPKYSIEVFNVDGDHMLTPEVLRREFPRLEAARQAFNAWLANGGARAWV